MGCAAGDFEAVFVAGGGDERRVPWDRLPELVGEFGRPVRSFSCQRGRRSYPGWYWSSTLGQPDRVRVLGWSGITWLRWTSMPR